MTVSQHPAPSNECNHLGHGLQHNKVYRFALHQTNRLSIFTTLTHLPVFDISSMSDISRQAGDDRMRKALDHIGWGLGSKDFPKRALRSGVWKSFEGKVA